MVLPRTIRRNPDAPIDTLSKCLSRVLGTLIATAILCIGAFHFHWSICYISLCSSGVYFTVRGYLPKKTSSMRDALKHTLYLGIVRISIFLSPGLY